MALREGILEAFTGIVSGLKDTEKGSHESSPLFSTVSHCILVSLLLPHAGTIIEVCQRAMADQDRVESTPRLVFGLIGDLASAFPNGEIKQVLLVDWIAAELRPGRLPRYSGTTKQIQRYAREVSGSAPFVFDSRLTSSSHQQFKRATA